MTIFWAGAQRTSKRLGRGAMHSATSCPVPFCRLQNKNSGDDLGVARGVECSASAPFRRAALSALIQVAVVGHCDFAERLWQ